MSGGVDTTKPLPLSPRALAFVLACVTSSAHAEVVHLPLTGLLVELPGEGWQVASRWSPAVEPFEPATGDDALTAPSGATYHVMAGGRTDRPCPLANPFVIDLDTREWIHDPTTNTLCRLENDARLEVRIEGPAELDVHRPILAALAEAFEARKVPERAVPPRRDPRVTQVEGREPPLTMPTIQLEPERPDDGYVWRVAKARDGRWFDALVRVFPTFPEVQLLVYRHAREDLPTCTALAQRQVARGPWQVSSGAPAVIERSLGRFTILQDCAPTDDGLIEVRVASAPRLRDREVDKMLAALHSAARTQPLPELPATVPARDFQWRWASASAGVILPEARDALVFGEAEVGLAYARRNGIFLRGVGRIGASADGALGGGSVDIGVALGADPELTLVLALGVREDVDPVLENRTFTGTLELYSGFNRDRAFAWALRFIPFHVASRQPAVGGAPLLIAWDGIFPSGVMVGVDLRWIDRPLEPQPGWVGSGVVIGLRLGLASFLR